MTGNLTIPVESVNYVATPTQAFVASLLSQGNEFAREGLAGVPGSTVLTKLSIPNILGPEGRRK